MSLRAGRTTALQRLGRQDGQAMVEFALVLPLLVLILVGIVQLGFFFQAKESLRDGVRAAAREWSLCRSPNAANLPNPNTVYHGIVDSSLAKANNPAPINNTPPWPCPATAAGTQITLTGQYNFSVNVLGILKIPAASLNTQAVSIVE